MNFERLIRSTSPDLAIHSEYSLASEKYSTCQLYNMCIILHMQTGIVSRNDDFWRGHPDVAYFQGYFYVVFRESKQHRETSTTRIMLTRSKHGFNYRVPICIAETNDRFNCPRLSVIENSLWIICDCVKQSDDFIGSENDTKSTRILL